MPGYDTIVAAAREAGAFGATLSGSGSTILALGPRERASDVADAMAAAWRARDVAAEGVVASIAGAAALG
jgi:homoserine kinase